MEIVYLNGDKLSYYLSNLNFYYPLANFTHEKIINGDINIDIEEFLSYCAASSAFLHPSEQLTQHGSKFISFCKGWLGEIIYEHQKSAVKELPEFYFNFAKKLKDSLLITFNWDTIVEHLLENLEIKYRYQLNVDKYEERNKSIPVLKLHGSIDWIQKSKYMDRHKNWVKLEKIGSSFKDIKKAKGDLSEYYKNMHYPCIVLPNYDKLNQIGVFGELWEAPWRYLNDKLEVIIIGYSLRKDDFHARSFIYPRLVHLSRSGDLNIKVVDFAKDKKDEEQIKERYIGVENCKFWFNGFNENSLNFIFD